MNKISGENLEYMQTARQSYIYEKVLKNRELKKLPLERGHRILTDSTKGEITGKAKE